MPVAGQARILDIGATRMRGRILHDRRLGLEPSEETLTQNFVSDYAARVRRAGLSADVREFTKHEESTLVGADIALWFYDAAGSYAGIYLQAKRLFPDGTYRGLNHAHGRQYQMLIDGARRDGVLAAYAFYNGLGDAEPARAACGHGIGATDISGITIASAASLGAHLPARLPRTAIEHLCSPLSCLVRHASISPGGTPRTAGGDALGGDGSGEGRGEGGPGQDEPGPGGLPLVLSQFAQQWPDSGFEVLRGDSVPDYLRRFNEDVVEAQGEYDLPDPSDYPEFWGIYPPGGRIYDRGDLAPTATVLLIGPK